MEKETRTIHPDSTVLPEGNRPLTSPIYQSVKFAPPNYEAMFSGKNYFSYSRISNPTVRELETLLSQLQGTEDGIGVASGVAAISSTLLALLKQGDEVLCFLESYKPSRVLLREMQRFGVKHHFVSLCDHAQVEMLLKSKKIRMLLVESPTNPMLRVPDLEKLLKLCRENGVLAVLDNTFAGFHNHGQYPFDLFLHSLTKFAGGHGDAMGGIILGSKALIEKVRHFSVDLGPTLDPNTAFLILRGMKTYFLRYRAQCQNALKIAEFLSLRPEVEKVIYPGLPSHPDFALAKKQLKDFGAVVTFNLKPGSSMASFFNQLKFFRIAASLGSVDSLAAPVQLFYGADLDDKQQQIAGISPTSVRLAAGLEHIQDLIADLTCALES